MASKSARFEAFECPSQKKSGLTKKSASCRNDKSTLANPLTHLRDWAHVAGLTELGRWVNGNGEEKITDTNPNSKTKLHTRNRSA